MRLERGAPGILPGNVAPQRARGGRRNQALRFLGFGALAVVLVLGIGAIIAQRKRARDFAEIGATAKFFDRHGQKIRYYLAGEANPGPTVVMLSGFLGALEQWQAAQQAMINIAPVLTYDRCGYGLSDPPPASDANAQADELADLAGLKSIKLPLVVVGFSSSSLIARAFAKRHAELLGGLVFLDPTNPEQIIGVSTKDLYARRVLYERVPLVMLAKRFVGLPSADQPNKARPTLTDQRAAQILNFPSHWWAAYREGAKIGESAQEAQLDWSKLHVPISLLSVANAHGTPEGKERYRLYLRFVEASGAEMITPTGFNHDQVHSDAAFLPHIVAAVAGVVAKVRLQTQSHAAPPK